MTWVRLDDHFDEHPKVAAAGPLGIALYVVSIAYANRNLTDGFIPASVAPRLIALEQPYDGNPEPLEYANNGLNGIGHDLTAEDVAATLVNCGLWKPVKGGYRIHDYNDYQPSKERVLAEREAAKQRMAKGRNSRGSPEHRANKKRSSKEVPPKFADPVPGREEPLQGTSSRTGTSPTTRDDAAPPSLANASSATSSSRTEDTDEEDDDMKTKRPAYDVLHDLITNGGYQYSDQALQDEIELQQRRRGPMNPGQADELLTLANQMRQAQPKDI